MTDGWGISCELALRWMSLDLIDENSTLVQVMAWCRQAASPYLSQWWPRSLLPFGVTRPQWVKKGSHCSNLLIGEDIYIPWRLCMTHSWTRPWTFLNSFKPSLSIRTFSVKSFQRENIKWVPTWHILLIGWATFLPWIFMNTIRSSVPGLWLDIPGVSPLFGRRGIHKCLLP